MKIRIPDYYELVLDEKLDDINSNGIVIRHKKTNARVVLVDNDDDNKVFYIGFRTPPKNSTGVAHILEHSVLCGSKKYPSKEPFVELIKGSLNTFLNAMTYSDKTVYPVASFNDKDFQNLISVYLDAVFYPNIYNKKEIFLQEGWHYHLENEEDEITYNGVVYNEMKGVFSSPEQQLFRMIQNSLYPDTAYGVESGGHPDNIIDLSYEEFLDFHSKYYHPSNSYIYLYGNMDFNEKLEWIHQEYLDKFDYLGIDSSIQAQKPFKEKANIKDYYSLANNEEIVDNTYLAYNFVIGNTLERELTIAFQILDYVLLSAPGAPIKQALIDAGIGKDILSSFQDEMLQPMFTIIAKNANEIDKAQFVEIIEKELKKIIDTGINESSLEAAINYYEFRYREADFGTYPKGLIYGLGALGSWLYDDEQPFLSLHGSKDFEYLKSKVGTDFYTNLIDKYLLNNSHSTIITLIPKKGLAEEGDKELKKQMADLKASLSKDEIKTLVEETNRLIAYQEEPSLEEELEKIPLLNREDISLESKPFINEETKIKEVKAIHHLVHTNGIAYMRFLFDLQELPQELIPYMSILSDILGVIDTKNYKYLDLSNEINISTGGIYTDVISFSSKGDTNKFYPYFEIGCKVLYDKIPNAINLIEEIIYNTDFSDTKRIENLLNEMKSRMEMKFLSAGHSVAVDRAMSYYSEHGLYKEQLSGITFYEKTKEILNNYEIEKEELITRLKELLKTIFNKDKLIISITSDKTGYDTFKESAINFVEGLENNNPNDYKLLEKYKNSIKKPEQLNEGLMTASQVQYVARVGNFMRAGYDYTGALRVLKVILSFDYLWNNIRVKGGAYGCMNGFSALDGDAYFVSYRDPNLRETNEVYENVVEYIKNFTASERDITKYIIGTISGIDTPLTPPMLGRRSFSSYITGRNYEDVVREREEVLNVTNEDINALAPLVEEILKDNNICVVGNEGRIEEERVLFKEVRHLI